MQRIIPKKTTDTVKKLKIFLSATFTIDISVGNMNLRAVYETNNADGSRKYIPWQLDDDDEIVGLHDCVENNKLLIWVSKKINRNLWHWLENRWEQEIQGKDNRRAAAELEEGEMIEEAARVIEWEWLKFVRRKSEDIDDVFNFTENVWKNQDEKEKCTVEYGTSTHFSTTVRQIEGRKRLFERFRMNIYLRYWDETDELRYGRWYRFNELFLEGYNPRSV